MKRRHPRIVIFAPHFAEYAIRLTSALGTLAPTLVVVDRFNRANECDQGLMDTARQTTVIMEFDSRTRLQRRISLLLVSLRILLFRPNIVHVQEQGDVLTAAIVRILRRFVKIVLTVHDPNPHSGNDMAYALRKAPYLRLLRESSVMYHVHGETCRNLLIEKCGKDKPIVSTAHGVLLVPLNDVQREPEPRRILLFGRMEAYKGVEDLLDATDLLSAQTIAFHLVLAGKGPELERLSKRLDKENITVISKFLTPDEAGKEFERAAVVIIPYRDATQSGVVAAAFGNDRPVIATRTGGLVDAVRDGIDGLLIPSCSPSALADAIRLLLSDADLYDHLQAGARKARLSHFSWNVIALTLLDAYSSIMTDA